MERPHQAQRGFTLIEAALVLSIGVTVFTSAIVLYGQYKKSASNLAAYDKVVALQERVEALNSQLNAYPDLSRLSYDWANRRPNDFRSSPWGGLSLADAGSPQASSVIGNYTPYTTQTLINPPLANDRGILVYYQCAPPPTPIGPVAVGALDITGGAANNLFYFNYLVGIVANDDKERNGYFFVRGQYPSAAANTDLSGQIGSGGSGGAGNFQE